MPEGAEPLMPQSSASGGGPSGGGDALPGLTRLTPENVEAQLESVSSQAGRISSASSPSGAPSSGKFRTVTHRFYEWEHLNTQPPIWRRDESQLTDKDYVDFYKSTFKVSFFPT